MALTEENEQKEGYQIRKFAFNPDFLDAKYGITIYTKTKQFTVRICGDGIEVQKDFDDANSALNIIPRVSNLVIIK